MKLEDRIAQEEIFRTELELQLIIMETDSTRIWISVVNPSPFAVIGSVKEAKPVEMIEQYFEKLFRDIGESGPAIDYANIKYLRAFHNMTVQTHPFKSNTIGIGLILDERYPSDDGRQVTGGVITSDLEIPAVFSHAKCENLVFNKFFFMHHIKYGSHVNICGSSPSHTQDPVGFL